MINNISTFKIKFGYFKLITENNRIISFYPTIEKYEKKSINLVHKKLFKDINNYLMHNKELNYTCNPKGTKFQLKVWNEVKKIKYGTTITYHDIANKINTSPRAIGNACAQNKCLFIIPCHRVICKNGELGGFILGKKIKKSLINFEKNGK